MIVFLSSRNKKESQNRQREREKEKVRPGGRHKQRGKLSRYNTKEGGDYKILQNQEGRKIQNLTFACCGHKGLCLCHILRNHTWQQITEVLFDRHYKTKEGGEYKILLGPVVGAKAFACATFCAIIPGSKSQSVIRQTLQNEGRRRIQNLTCACCGRKGRPLCHIVCNHTWQEITERH